MNLSENNPVLSINASFDKTSLRFFRIMGEYSDNKLFTKYQYYDLSIPKIL
jgi:hypothetical protein